MLVNFDSYNPIIVQFPRFAGGKFISNCLSLSCRCLPQDRQLAEYLLVHPTDYKYRADALARTLPPQEKMTSWIQQYELGDTQLYGVCHALWRQGVYSGNELIAKLSNSDLKFLS